MALPDPKIPTRKQLNKFLPDHEAVKLFERLFNRAGNLTPGDVETLYRLTQEVLIDAGTASAEARQAIALIGKISDISSIESGNAIAKAQLSLDLIQEISDIFRIEAGNASAKAQRAVDLISEGLDISQIESGTAIAKANQAIDSAFLKIGKKIYESATGSVLFVGLDGNLAQDNANIFWDNVNKRMGIGTDSPSQSLDLSAGNLITTGTVQGVTQAELDTLTDTSNADALHDHTEASVTVTHASTTGQGADDHHAESHTIVSHSDTSATGAELNTLTDDSMADALHRHSELSASDGSPNPALSVDATGKVGIGLSAPVRIFHVESATVNILARFQSNDNFASIEIQDINGTSRIEQGSNGLSLSADNGVTDNLVIDPSGKVGIGTVSPNAKLDVVGDARVGDSTTNYTEVSSTGDVVFVGGAGLPFAEIYYMNIAGSDTVLAAQDTWYQITAFDTNGLSNNATPDHTNDHITVTKAGKYRISFSISSRSAAANLYHFMVFKNNGGTGIMNIMAHRVTSVAGRIASDACGGYADLAVNDTIELWVKRLDGGAVAKTITAEHVTLSLEQKAG